ncbi:hypothetical protein FISHEDRAFT_74836 [Fistulina hepatica ATCC 64428]|uniref:C2H2-type domain-containing protein n=1 Tax=Fistulina hepatica ATCC 64428 TaxID=1128425 RepID=A0A0D7A8A8_9AGAR|nr:hypothetical protein FISHEDRAFT_74836 [Fistulina hepatica ATCC 64428]
MSSSTSQIAAAQAILAKYNVILQQQLQLPVCMKCKCLFKPTTIGRHLQKIENMMVDNQDLKDALFALGANSDFPPLPTAVVPPYASVRIEPAWKCSLCPHITRNQTLRHRQQHLTTKHQGQGVLEEIQCQAFSKEVVFQVQTIANTPSVTVIRPRHTAPSTFDVPAEIAMLDTQPIRFDTNITNVNNRNVTPWLKTTGWHLFIGDHPVKPLLQWTDSPKVGEFNSLSVAVKAYFLHAYSLIDETDLLTKQLLDTPDPQATGTSNTPFHKHDQPTTLTDSYVPYATRLLAMLIRPSVEGFELDLPEDIEEAISQLKEADEQPTMDMIHDALFALWSSDWMITRQDKIVDPTVRFLAFATLLPGGGWKEPSDVTYILARFFYLMHLTFLYEMHRRGNVIKARTELAIWYTEKQNNSSFNSLSALQHRASHISLNTRGMPRLWFEDRTTFQIMHYKSHKLEWKQISELFAHIQAMTVEYFEKEILSVSLTD